MNRKKRLKYELKKIFHYDRFFFFRAWSRHQFDSNNVKLTIFYLDLSFYSSFSDSTE